MEILKSKSGDPILTRKLGDPAIYASEGRIRKLILFDSTKYKLRHSFDPYEVFAPVRKKHVGLIIGLQKLHKEKEFHIFFSCNQYGYCPQPWYELKNRTWYIPMDDRGELLSLPTKWVQDIVSFNLNGQLLFNRKSISHKSWTHVAGHIGVQIKGTNEKRIEGGNFLTGRHNKKELLLVGKRSNGLSYDVIKKHFNADQIYNCYNSSMEKFDKLYFHLDYYMAFVGTYPTSEEPGKDAEKPLLLTSSIDYIKPSVINDPKPENPTPVLGSNAIMFEQLSIPMVVFLKPGKDQMKSDKDILFALSYTNCIIENYIENKKRRINIYFPDFRELVTNFFQTKTTWEDHMKSLQLTIENLTSFTKENSSSKCEVSVLDFTNISKEELKEELNKFFKCLHNYLTETLSKKIHGVNVQFVPYNFFNLARRNGSLHCVTKVIERDMVD
jgi:hypothetical protein